MALLTSKSVTCISCNARNPETAQRCRICTAPLHFDGNAMTVEHNRDLYTTRVSDWKPDRSKARWIAAILVLIGGIIVYNYAFYGWGPDWAHRPFLLEATERWVTYKGFGDNISVRMPGSPIERTTTDGAGPAAVSVVDGDWNPVLDRTTTTPKQLTYADSTRKATVVAALLPSEVGPPTIGLDNKVATLVNDVTLSGARTSIVKKPNAGVQGDLVANFRGYPAANRSGVVHARAYQLGEKTLVVATFYERGLDLDMHDFLLDNVKIVE